MRANPVVQKVGTKLEFPRWNSTLNGLNGSPQPSHPIMEKMNESRDFIRFLESRGETLVTFGMEEDARTSVVKLLTPIMSA